MSLVVGLGISSLTVGLVGRQQTTEMVCCGSYAPNEKQDAKLLLYEIANKATFKDPGFIDWDTPAKAHKSAAFYDAIADRRSRKRR
jgi:hypothetical protein